MKLPIPFLKSKKSNNQYYLALILDDEKVGSVILEEKAGKAQIVGKHEEYLLSPIETISQEELIAIVDKAISRAEEVLPPNIETHKTVFGVKESWVEKETKKIDKDYLAKLKKVCDALDLTPIGFMVISEAIANLLQNEEGAPLSAILVELSRNTAHVTLFRGGQINESISGPIEHSAPMTVDNLLKKFTAPVLPTKIILSYNKESKNLTHHFTSHEWSSSLPFLHVPQVTILPEYFDRRAITYGAVNQMGFELIELDNLNSVAEKTADPILDPVLSEKEVPVPITEVTQASSNFGFISEEDIETLPPEKIHREPELPAHVAPVINIKDHEIKPVETATHTTNLHHAPPIIHEEIHETITEPITRNARTNKFSGLKAKALSFNFLNKIKFPAFLKKSKGLTLGIIALSLILLLGASLYAFYFYNVTADVVLSVKPKEVTKEENVTFSIEDENEFSNNIIAAKSISTTVEGELTTPATGKKDAGEKSKGSVTVYNNAGSDTTLSSGTAIKSSNGLTFLTDKDVKLASASGDIFSGTKPGTAQVAVTAKDIGSESNMPSNTKFSIGGNNTLAAKNDNAFSGGSKKAITVVSKNDLAKLRADLPKSLEQKALDDLSSKKDTETTSLPGFIKITIIDEDFDRDLDAEAKQVKLKASVKFEGMSYQNSDLEEFNKSLLKKNDSENADFAVNSLKNELKDIKVKNENEMQALLFASAGLLPKIDNMEVANKIQSKSPGQAKEILSTIPQVVNSEIKYSPNILYLSQIFPKLPKKINVSVKAN